MTSVTRELVILILQFLDEEKFKETVHRLEQDSGFFFNMKYFEDEVLNGNWDAVERYLCGFTKIDDNRFSRKIFFEIRKQKYLEALDKHDRAKAVDILVKDLKIFASFNEGLFKELTQLLTLENFREKEQLSKYGNTQSARAIMVIELKKLIEANPLLENKLRLPKLKPSRLRTLINQSFNWQHQLCKNPKPDPNFQTLFADHGCGQSSGACVRSTANNPMLGPIQKAGGLPVLAAHTVMPFEPASVPVPTSLTGWISNPQRLTHPAAPSGATGLGDPTNHAAIFMQSKTATATKSPTDYPSTRPFGNSEENHNQVMYIPDDLPRAVARTLNQGSSPTSMDFHPIQPTVLVVGTNVGDIGLWDIGTRVRLALKHFKVWELGACSTSLQGALANDPVVSVNRIKWSPDGTLFGVACSLHIVQIYSYHGVDDIRQHLEIDAHVGGVNDLAFAHLNKQPSVITCGDDKTIKVWDSNSGTKQFIFEGHEASVYSVCPHNKENIQFIFSTGLDGKIKAWLYDNLGSRVDYDAPGRWCTMMAYSADGSRLFSCGTSKEGDSYMVEWNETEGSVKRTYSGFSERSSGVVQFDTTRNCFLAAGDEFLIKFWDMDRTQLLTTFDADGGLPASSRIRFNKDGSLLAVSTLDNGIKVLANTDGLRLLRTFENRSFESFSKASETMTKNVDSINNWDVKPRLLDESTDKAKIWKLMEIHESSQCQSLRLFDKLRTTKISRLIYTNSGFAILALASNAVHYLWKWPRNDRKPAGKVTTDVTPQLWQPASGISMTNDIGTNPEEAVPCIALSKNDSYVMSASGGKISLFTMMTFKMMKTFMPPPPAATFIAFHPQDNNVVAIGTDDSTIQIYDVRVDQVKIKLRGHSKRITGLAFSHVLNVLVSSGADAQICVWESDGWDKQRSKSLQIPSDNMATFSDTCIQFHQDQIHLLAVHKAQIAIYDAAKLECLKQWVPHEGFAPISYATFSCDSQSVYASFVDATVCVFSSTSLSLRCRINPTAYLPVNIRSKVYPLVIAAHPSDPNQFAIGLTDGAVHILEPLESEGKWGVPPPTENGTTSGTSPRPPPSEASSDEHHK